MKQLDEDPLLSELRARSVRPLEDSARARVQRLADEAFRAEHAPGSWWVQAERAWSRRGLPVVLLATGVFYVVTAVSAMTRIYGPTDRAAWAARPHETAVARLDP
jgi:hypothetical protein